MPITVNCTCGKTLSAPDEAAGQRVKCPACGAIVPVPGGLVAAEEVAAPDHKPLSGPAPPPTRPFMLEVPLAFFYPFRGAGIIILPLAAFVFSVLMLFGFGLITWIFPVIAYAYMAAYFLSIVQNSAGGDPNLPTPPDFTDIVDDIIKPIFLMLAAAFASFLPQIIYGVTAWWLGFKIDPTVLLIMSVWSAFYFPMAIMSVAIWRSFLAVSPHVVFPAILKIPGQHLLMTGMVWLIWQGYVYVRGAVAPRRVTSFLGFFAALCVANLVFLYFTWVIGRVIGITHWSYRKKIAWFRTM